MQAELRKVRRGPGEHERRGRLEFAVAYLVRAGCLQSHRPPVLLARADLGEFNRAPGLPADQREPADSPPLPHRHPADRVGILAAEPVTGKGPFLPGLHPAQGATRHLEDSRATLIRLYLKGPARADLHREPAKVRFQQVDVLPYLHLARELPEPSGHRRPEPARQDPAHLEAADALRRLAIRLPCRYLSIAGHWPAFFSR